MKYLQSTMTDKPSSGCPFAQKTTTASSTDEGKGSEDSLRTSTRSGRNSDSTSSFGSCPFAQALHHNKDSDDSSCTTENSAMLSFPPSPGSSSSSLPWKECPVFANKSCPFRNAKSSDDVSQILRQLPASHTDQSLPTHAVLIETLAYFHRDKAMEEFSFSAIMTRLAQEHYAKSSAELDNNDDSSSEFGINGEEEKNREEKDLHEYQNIPETADPSNDALPPKQGRRLSEALKTGTEEAHKEAESVHFVKNFIRGKIDRNLYALFVAQMFHVYRRLETELDNHASKNFAACHFPRELNRSEALCEDIDFWQGSSDEPPISPATQDYLDRITTVAKERPLLLLAHAYTRYLGDLSGGKILARVAKRALHLDSGPDGLTEGLAFYDFPLLRGSVKSFKDNYRQALNDLEFEDSDEAVRAIVQEANIAFLLNMRLFEELDVIGSVPGASVRPIGQVYSHSAKISMENKEQDTTESAAQCPFANMSNSSAFQHVHNHNSSVAAEPAKQKSRGTCPWPFIFCHDPKTGMRQWQTWVTIGLLLMYVHQNFHVGN